MRYFLILVLFVTLQAEEAKQADKEYSFRVAYGIATTKSFGQILLFNVDKHPDNLSVISLDAGYLLKENLFDVPLDLYVKGGFSRFKEVDKHTTNKLLYPFRPYYVAPRSDAYEGTLYVKAYYNLDFWDNRVRLGFGEGVSYTTSLLWIEEEEAVRENEKYSKFLNYLDVSVDVDLGKLVGYEPLEDTYIGWTLKHRSGVFGLFNGVSGGSNYNTFSIEKKF